MNSRFIIAAGDISSFQVLERCFREKTAKKVYPSRKDIVLTCSVTKLLKFADSCRTY